MNPAIERVKTTGTITNAPKNIIPGAKNLSGTERFVKYVKARSNIQMAKKIAIFVSPVPKAAIMK